MKVRCGALRNGSERQRLAKPSKRLSQDRKEQLAELSFERCKNKSILNCMTDGVLVVNRQRQVVLSNAAAARIFDDLSLVCLPADVAAIIKNPTLMEFHDEISACDDDRIIRAGEFSLDRGTYIVNATAVSDPCRENLGVVLVFRDITALKKPHIARAMFVSMAAEQVCGFLDKIEKETYLLAEKSPACFSGEAIDLETIKVQTTALRRMFHHLSHLVGMEAERFSLKRCPISLATILEQSVRSVAELARWRQVSIRLCFCESLTTCLILADHGGMERVFQNILDNAISYNRPGGTVQIDVKDSGTFISVSIKDTGIGMTDEEREKIFDVFYRAPQETTRQVPGAGVGLSLVKHLVDMHQGIITCRSQPKVGTEFNVKLPKA